MVEGIPRGQLIRPEARIPQSLLSSANRYSRTSRMLSRGEIARWNANNERLLWTFGLRIVGVEEMELKAPVREPKHLELLLSERAALSMVLSALAVALKGRGDLLDVSQDQRKGLKTKFKEMADLRASATELEVLQSIVDENTNVAFVVRVGEGGGEAGRRKPGEALNASLFPGQIIVNQRHAGKSVQELERMGVRVYRIATDPIDGTGKTTLSESSALTSLLAVDGEIATLPDMYMEKLTVNSKAAGIGLDTNEPLDKIVQGISDSNGVPPDLINGFALRRDRHPIEQLLHLGINMVLDSDGDLLPAVAPGAQPGVYENNLPLHAMIGDAGGAAEYLIAAAANQWLGGESHGAFVSAKGMKRGWEGRRDYTPEERQVVEAAGFKLATNYPIAKLVDLRDGLAVFGGITSNSHFPQLSGVYLGENYAQVDVIQVGASGRFTKRRFTFTFENALPQMIQRFNPVSEALMQCDLRDIRGTIRDILADQSRAGRLRREIALSFYHIFSIDETSRFVVKKSKMEELADERTAIIVGNLQDLAPDWFTDCADLAFS
ncbi:MAG: fructose-bisphosphatase class II [Candidatus Margulisbacteria bacterium]|nr:fructose-bisphosphatase class II [Candidatus Margulisiibacteriota bacterium]